MDGDERERVLEEVRSKTQELAAMLDDFSGRLRRLRQRNRQVEDEIALFEEELERLRSEVLDSADE